MSEYEQVHEPPPSSGDEPRGYTFCTYLAYAGERGKRRLKQKLRAEAAAALEQELVNHSDVHLRGIYSLAGFRAEADIMFWLVGRSAAALQTAVIALEQSEVGRSLIPWWAATGTHRQAEFTTSHVPAFYDGEDPREWLSVYPFNRSLEWYLLAPKERSAMLREHGMMAAGYADVRGNTTANFALGDYEWLLAFEADDLGRIVDVMRELRAATARRHTRLEVPFLTGRRLPLADAIASLP